jgi:hypothetical protein
MDKLLDLILGALNLIYGERWVAPFVVLPLMFAAAAFVRHKAQRTTEPYLAAAKQRVSAIRDSLGSDVDPIAERRAFSENYITVSAIMNEDGPGAHELVQAWREFQESMVDETSSPVRNTSRPSSFFNRAAPKQTNLTFASNIFVGVGLILTFLGLIVALNTAANGMSGDNVNAAKLSLVALLTVAGAKFFTSVAGLGASIWLRFVEHRLTRQVRHETDLISQLLERGLLYVSPQKLAVEQLEVMKEQRDQLKFFNTDVALQLSERIGVQFNQAIAPVAASLNQLNDNMASVTQGIGAGAREAIEKVSGEQLQGLSDTLAGLSQKLDVVTKTVGASSDDAANQIRLAGADFATAASDIRNAFQQLTGQVDGIGARLTDQGDAATKAQQVALQDILAGLGTAQAQSVAMVTEVIAALKSAGTEAAVTMRGELGDALKTGVEESQKTFRIAVEESGTALRETTGNLSKAVGDAAQQVERASISFARSGDHAERTADAMTSVSDQARTVALSLGDAAQGFASAAGPVAEAASSVNQAALQIKRTVEADRAADSLALSEMKSLAEGVRATQEAAQQAWQTYSSRFEGVDQSLSKATEAIAITLGDSLTQFRQFAQDTDREMAAAVSRLGNALTQIQEYADSLDEYVEETRKFTREAAE